MAVLSDDVKAFIVQGLACFDTPSVVVESVNQEFGLVISRQQVEKYDPTKQAGKGLSKKWPWQTSEGRAFCAPPDLDPALTGVSLWQLYRRT